MGRKRLEKKERQRLESLERQLEALAGRGADEELLALLHRHGRAPLSPGVAGLYTEVVDRTLRKTLAGGDLPRLDRLIREIRPEVAARPWVRLAAAVAHLGEGRLEEARAGLTALRSVSLPPQIEAASTVLLALCEGPGAEAPVPRALDRLYRSLSTLSEQGCRPEAVDREEMEEGLGILREALSTDPAARKLLDAAQACLFRLGELADLEKALREEEESAGLHRLFLERVRHLAGPLLEVFRDSPAAALIQPLRHAVRLRWRAVLSLLIERGDDAVWAAALAESPALFSLDLEAGDGRGAGTTRLAHRQAARELLAAGRYQELARRLASWGRSEPVPERLARLWSLELWAWERAATVDTEDGIERAFSDPELHDILPRLAAMAGEIEPRFPAEQRPAVARFLRTQLFDFFETLFFGDHFFIDAAAALLRHLPDDPGLLALAVTAAVCTEDHRACGLFASRIASRKGAPNVEVESEIEPLLRLIPQLAHEPPRYAARILPLVRPLLGEESWSGAVSAFVQRVANLTCSCLRRDDREFWVQDVLRDLAIYRAALPASGVLAVLEAAVRCLLRSAKPEDLRQTLERTPGLEPAIVALRALVAGAPPGARASWCALTAFEEARETVIERLDANWRLWRPLLPALVVDAGKGTVRRLRNRLQQILRQEDLGDMDRKALESALEGIQSLQRLASEMRSGLPPASRKKTAEPARETERAPRAKKPRRRRVSEDVQPELF